MDTWYNKYMGFPYKHLGEDPKTGIDCFNLCKYVIQQETNIKINYSTKDFCSIKDEEWYNNIDSPSIKKAFEDPNNGWRRVDLDRRKIFDVAIMSMGSTNNINHISLFVEREKMLQILIGRASYITKFGNFYKDCIVGCYRRVEFLNN